MKNLRNFLIGGLILSGVFSYGGVWETLHLPNENNPFYVAKLSFFIFLAGCMGSIILAKKNQWIGLLGLVCSFGFLKTFLFNHAPRVPLFESCAIGFGLFVIYYAVRELNLKEGILKFFIFPAVLNILLIFAQAIDHNVIPFIPTIEKITGFLGNKSYTACFLALTLPIFIKYFKWGVPFLLAAIILCNSGVGFIACVISGLFYLYYMNRKAFKWCLVVVLLASAAYAPFFINSPSDEGHKYEVRLRMTMWAGSFNGIMHNPVFGWGIGSFIPVVSQIPPKDSEFLGLQFNSERYIMNHPHNELLSGWWKMGAAFPIVILIITWKLIRKFAKNNVLSFSIMVAGIVISMGWYFELPAALLFVMSVGIYENKGGERWPKLKR